MEKAIKFLMSVTAFRILSLAYGIYFFVGLLGASGSYWTAFQGFMVLAAAWALGHVCATKTQGGA